MKIWTKCYPLNGQWHAEIGLTHEGTFSAVEQERLRERGSPLVEVGGLFSGVLSRPGDSDPSIIVEGDGTGADLVPIITNGKLTAVTIVDGGSGYTEITEVTVTPGKLEGRDSGKHGAVELTLSGGSVVAATIVDEGQDYPQTTTPMEFTHKPKTVRLPNDFPVKTVFDTRDYFNADLMALLWLNEVKARMAEARDQLILTSRSSSEAETIQTI